MSRRFLKAALPPSRCRTGTRWLAGRLPSVVVVSSPPGDGAPLAARSRSRSLCLAVGGHGGVSGTLVRKDRQLGRRGKRHPGRSPICVWCRRQDGAPGVALPDRDGNRNDRTSRCRHEGVYARYSRYNAQNRSESSREFRGARLDFSVHIWVRRPCPAVSMPYLAFSRKTVMPARSTESVGSTWVRTGVAAEVSSLFFSVLF